jgi:Rap1a immunity proteins
MKALLWASIAVLLSQGRADAEPVSGSLLYEWCRAPAESVQSSFCLGFIMGVADMVDSQDLPLKICLKGSSSLEVKDTVVTYIKEQPVEARHQAATAIVYAGLGKSFPCPQ